MASLPTARFTLEEYLAHERQASHKSEFLSGQIFGMAGASFQHTVLTANILRALGRQMPASPCQAVASDLRVQVLATGLNTYPDIVALCEAPAFTDDFLDTLTNPAVLMEVLSPSTEAYDRGEKFAHYRRIDSLIDYVLVSQHKQRIEHYHRQGQQWVLTEYTSPEERIALPALGCDLPLAEIYDRVVFAEA